MKTTQDEMKPAEVPERATQAGEAGPKNWEWVERHVWTQRMLEALAKGVKGGVWFSLIDKIQRPKTLIQRKRQGLHGISRGYEGKTTDRRAVCGRSASTVRREGRRKPMRRSYPYRCGGSDVTGMTLLQERRCCGCIPPLWDNCPGTRLPDEPSFQAWVLICLMNHFFSSSHASFFIFSCFTGKMAILYRLFTG